MSVMNSKKWLKNFTTLGTISSVFSFSTFGYCQEFIDKLRGGMNVVATAGIGTNNDVTIITLTDVNFLKSERCRRLRPDQIESCFQNVEAQGMLRTEWTINCSDFSVISSKQASSEPITHRIDPQVIVPPRAILHSYIIYDYACGTHYSDSYFEPRS
jgi:hypothetical protein